MVVILWPFIDTQFHVDHYTERIWIIFKKTMNRASLEVQGAQRHEVVQRMARRRRRRRRRPKVESSTWVPQLEEGLLSFF